VTTFVPAGPQRSRWWWLRFWRPAYLVVGTAVGVAVWRSDAHASTWLHAVVVAVLFALLLSVALVAL
jgi:hypothetical protein